MCPLEISDLFPQCEYAWAHFYGSEQKTWVVVHTQLIQSESAVAYTVQPVTITTHAAKICPGLSRSNLPLSLSFAVSSWVSVLIAPELKENNTLSPFQDPFTAHQQKTERYRSNSSGTLKRIIIIIIIIIIPLYTLDSSADYIKPCLSTVTQSYTSSN